MSNVPPDQGQSQQGYPQQQQPQYPMGQQPQYPTPGYAPQPGYGGPGYGGPGYGGPQPQSHTARNIILGCLALFVIGGIVSVILVVLAARHVSNQIQSVASSIASAQATPEVNTNCSPQPCASKDGYVLTVTVSSRNLAPGQFETPEPGNHYVSVVVHGHNGSSSTQDFSSLDFRLIDSGGVSHDTAFTDAAGCDSWSSVQLTPGADSGSKTLCFEAGGAPSGPLKLAWDPGFSTSEVDIPLQ